MMDNKEKFFVLAKPMFINGRAHLASEECRITAAEKVKGIEIFAIEFVKHGQITRAFAFRDDLTLAA